MRRLSLVVPTLVLLGTGCSSPEPLPPPVSETPAVVDRSAGIGALDVQTALAGRELETVGEGPWTTRRVARSSGEREAGDAAVELASKSGGFGGPTTGGGKGPSEPADSLDGDRGPAGARPSDPSPGSAPAPIELPAEDRAVERSEKGSAVDGAVAKTLARSSDSESGPVQTLRAGKTDDNADYAAYLEFLATWVAQKDIQSLYQPTDVSDRHFLRVTDAAGRPIPGAVVSILDEAADRVLWRGTTYGDGVALYYPHLVPGAAATPGTPLLVEAYVRDGAAGPTGARVEWDGVAETFDIALDQVIPAPDPIALDVCFVIDTTGSMSDEIASIKASLLRVTEQLRGLGREFDLRYSAVLYRDLGDDYVTATHPFTSDISAFAAALREVRAAGGGDTPESLNQALALAVDGVDWRPGAAKVAFLVADAPPHMDYDGDVPYGESARAALAKGIRVHSVAASGLDPVGTLAFRQIAQLARGRFIFIEYGSAAASAESHGVKGKVESDNLEDILFEQIRDELATFGRRG